ncbi:ankyrin repeat protein, partial [Necator americanus]
IIKAILEASPDLVAERDSSGNTALHVAVYKTPLMGLLLLKCKDVNLNAKNYAGQTPLHIFTHKGEIGLMVTLLSYCCDIDAQDYDGNTALHVAVTTKNIESSYIVSSYRLAESDDVALSLRGLDHHIFNSFLCKRICLATRLLLCLGADPNVSNSHGDTPRHLAARLKEKSILESLIMCGARSCGPKKLGCVSGCVNEAMVELLKLGCVSGCVNEAMVELLKSSPCMDNDSMRSSTTKFSSQTYPDSVDVNHPIRDFTQQVFYDELVSRLEQLAARNEKPTNMVNLLSMDGGGIRGLVILQVILNYIGSPTMFSHGMSEKDAAGGFKLYV